jgi:hypothetical protein
MFAFWAVAPRSGPDGTDVDALRYTARNGTSGRPPHGAKAVTGIRAARKHRAAIGRRSRGQGYDGSECARRPPIEPRRFRFGCADDLARDRLRVLPRRRDRIAAPRRGTGPAWITARSRFSR